MHKNNDTADIVPVKKQHETVEPYPLLSHFEKDIPYQGRMPQVDIIERDDEFYVRAELPGVNKNNVEIAMTENSVTIKERIKQGDAEENGNYYRREIPVGAYARTLKLPTRVNSDQSIAVFKDGLLELKLPKIQYPNSGNIMIE
jgi:HSP20 family protein